MRAVIVLWALYRIIAYGGYERGRRRGYLEAMRDINDLLNG